MISRPNNLDSADSDACHYLKIKARLEQTERNNKSKTYYNKFILRNCRMHSLPKEACRLLSSNEHLKRLKELDLSEMDLKSLANLPDFSFLIKLNLIMNLITDQEVKHIFKYLSLEVLYLSENLIRHLETVKSLSALPSLKQIDLTCNPVVYDRADLFASLKVKIVDRYTASELDLQRNRLFNHDDQNGSSQSGSELSEEQESYQSSVGGDNLYEESDVILKSSVSQMEDEQSNWPSSNMKSQKSESLSQKMKEEDDEVGSDGSRNQIELEKHEENGEETMKRQELWKGIFDNLL